MIIPPAAKRNYFGVPSSIPSDDNEKGNSGPSSTTVLIPLAISMILIILGIGLAVFLFVGYKRKQRAWVLDYASRRQREMEAGVEGEKEEKGPGMWEVEVREVEDMSECENEKNGVLSLSPKRSKSNLEWAGTPVSVTYHHDPLTLSPFTASPSLQSISKSISSISTSNSDLATTNTDKDKDDDGDEGPRHVEMTFLIAMPSPPTTLSRSRRSSPASSSSLESSRSSSSLDSIYGEYIPEVELGTVIMPVRHDYEMR